MRELHVGALAQDSGCALIAQISEVAPEFIVADDTGRQLVAARWRRKHVDATDHHLSDHLLSYCLGGEAACTVEADGERLFAQQRPRSLSLLRAGQSIRVQLDAPEDVVHVHLYLSPDMVADFARDTLGLADPPLLRNAMGLRDPWLENFFRLLISEYETYAHDLRLADSLFLDQTEAVLLSYLLSKYTEGTARSAAEPRGGPSRVSALRPTILKRVEAYVNENIDQPIRLVGLAEVATMSTGHFARAFHIATGMTPHQYVLARRLDKARDLLRNKSLPIAEIAEQCGFSGTAHFSTTFRHHHAVTPSRFRQTQ